MNVSRLTSAIAGFALFAVACDRHVTSPDGIQASLDAADPVVVMFTASQGLPGGPFGDHVGPPFMGGMLFGGAPAAAADGHGPGATFPDSIKLTDAQKTQIQALVTAFTTANAADLAAMKAAHAAARAAHQAGKSREEIKAILDVAKAAAERVRTNADALHTAIDAVLTPLQRLWLAAHRPDHPPHTP